MARGDVVSGIANVASGARLVFQPAVGVEVMITEVGSSEWGGTSPNRTPAVLVELTNGVLRSEIRERGEAPHWGGGILKSFITNSLYLSIHNVGAVSAHLAYTGIQTK